MTTSVTGRSQAGCGCGTGRAASGRGYLGVDSAGIVAFDELDRLQHHAWAASCDIASRGAALFSELLGELVPLQGACSKWRHQKAA